MQTFIDLVNRHEQSFYTFVHKVHSKGSNLFSSLMSWIELFLDFVRDGLPPTKAGGPHKLDLEFLLPHSGPERVALLKEVDAIAIYHYKLKVAHEGKTRRKFLREGGGKSGKVGAEKDDDDEQALIDSLVDGFSFGNTLTGDAAEIAEEESSSGEEDSDVESGDEEYGTPEGSETGGSIRKSARPPTSQQIASTAPDASPATSSAPSPHKKKHHVPRLHRSKDKEATDPTWAETLPPTQQTMPNDPNNPAQRHLPGHPPGGAGGGKGLYEKKEQGRHAKRKGKVAIEPPVIRHLPQLLPVFVEMVSPVLFCPP